MTPPGGEPLHPLDMDPDPVDGSLFRGMAFGCGIEALAGLAILAIVGVVGVLAGWWPS